MLGIIIQFIYVLAMELRAMQMNPILPNGPIFHAFYVSILAVINIINQRELFKPIGRLDGYIPISDVDDEVASQFLEQRDLQTKELLLPFQCFCSRRGVSALHLLLVSILACLVSSNYLLC